MLAHIHCVPDCTPLGLTTTCVWWAYQRWSILNGWSDQIWSIWTHDQYWSEYQYLRNDQINLCWCSVWWSDEITWPAPAPTGPRRAPALVLICNWVTNRPSVLPATLSETWSWTWLWTRWPPRPRCPQVAGGGWWLPHQTHLAHHCTWSSNYNPPTVHLAPSLSMA